ncbi:MAG TPA: hypothetical protein VFR94_03110 [Nitrososphaeraceae archaeon]|nr:hypothetical protein [Nitrososphaeraceae archaeon]
MLNLDLRQPVNYVSAEQIKQISHEEPRLMAKMDRYEQLPKIFKDNDVVLFPISRRGYAIVKGKGYHELEEISERPVIHVTEYPMPQSIADFESEQVFLNRAYSTGLVERFAKLSGLSAPLQIRIDTPHFDFRLDKSTISVDRAQIEIDAVTENPETLITIEAKIGVPPTFNIRQIYYPFRTFFQKKKEVRNLLFCFEPIKSLYMFWEYEFSPYNKLDDIRLIQYKKYHIKVSKSLSAKQFQNVSPVKEKIKIPQADKIEKIIQFPLRIAEGYDTSEKMVGVFGFTIRQSSYYRHAAEILGLVINDRYKYRLTDNGEEYLKLPAEKKSSFICKLILEFPIINSIFLEVSSDPKKIITKHDIVQLLKRRSDITGDTLIRRTRTITSWFKWIRNNLGLVEVDTEGNIRFSRQIMFQEK